MEKKTTTDIQQIKRKWTKKKKNQHSLIQSDVGFCDSETLLPPCWGTPLFIKYWVIYRKAERTSFLALNSHIESWEEDRNTNDATDTRLMLHCVELWCVTTGWSAGQPPPVWIWVHILFPSSLIVTQTFIFPQLNTICDSSRVHHITHTSLSSSISTPGVRKSQVFWVLRRWSHKPVYMPGYSSVSLCCLWAVHRCSPGHSFGFGHKVQVVWVVEGWRGGGSSGD